MSDLRKLGVGDLVVVTDEFRKTPFRTPPCLALKGEIGLVFEPIESSSYGNPAFVVLFGKTKHLMYSDELVVIG